MKNALIFGSSSFLISSSVYWKRFSCGAADVHDLEVVVLEVRHLEIGREDRRAERDRVAGEQQPVGLQRLEDVAHRGGAALDRVEVELAGRARLSAHRPHQILVHDPLVVDQHAIGHRIIVADDRIDEFVDECIRLEPELLDRELHHRGQEAGTGHVRVLREPGVEAAAMPLACGMPPIPARCSITRLLSVMANWPSRKKPSRGVVAIQFGLPRPAFRKADCDRLEVCLGQIDQLVLDLERAQSLEFLQRQNVSHDLLPVPWTSV